MLVAYITSSDRRRHARETGCQNTLTFWADSLSRSSGTWSNKKKSKATAVMAVTLCYAGNAREMSQISRVIYDDATYLRHFCRLLIWLNKRQQLIKLLAFKRDSLCMQMYQLYATDKSWTRVTLLTLGPDPTHIHILELMSDPWPYPTRRPGPRPIWRYKSPDFFYLKRLTVIWLMC